MNIHTGSSIASRALAVVALAFAFSNAQAQDTIRINCGGSAYTDAAGKSWAADSGFTGGTTYSTTDDIAGTSDATLYQTEEWGDTQSAPFSYTFDLPQGSYTVKLYFAEIYANWCQTGSRVFNVDINGTPVLQNFDIYDAAGCETALIRQFNAATVNGKITINFTNVDNLHPKVNAIEITPGTSSAISGKPNGWQRRLSVSNVRGGLSVQTRTEGAYTLELSTLQGRRVAQRHGFGSGVQSFTNLGPGLYLLTSRMGGQVLARTVGVVVP